MALEHSSRETSWSTSYEEMVGAAVSVGKNQNQISSNYSKEELTRILGLIWMKSLTGGTHPCWIIVPVEWAVDADVVFPTIFSANSTVWLVRKKRGGFIASQTCDLISLHVTWSRPTTPAHWQNQFISIFLVLLWLILFTAKLQKLLYSNGTVKEKRSCYLEFNAYFILAIRKSDRTNGKSLQGFSQHGI